MEDERDEMAPALVGPVPLIRDGYWFARRAQLAFFGLTADVAAWDAGNLVELSDLALYVLTDRKQPTDWCGRPLRSAKAFGM